MPLSVDEQTELDRLEFEQLSAEKNAASAPAAAAPAPAAMSDAQLAKQTWQSATSPVDRLKALMLGAPTYAAKPLKEMADAGIRGALPAAGQLAGGATGPFAPAAVPVFGAVGGAAGEALAQFHEGNGFSPGRIVGAGVAGAIPGSPLEGAGLSQVMRAGTKFAAGNVAAKAAETGIDEGRLPTVGEAAASAAGGYLGAGVARFLDKGVGAARALTEKGANATRDASLRAGQQAGYIVPGSTINPGAINSSLESTAGKAAVKQAARLNNQEVTNTLAKQEIGIPEGQAITLDALDSIRAAAAQPYQQISAMATKAEESLAALKQSTEGMSAHETAANRAVPDTAKQLADLTIQAGADVEALKRARFDMNSNFRYYGRSADPAALERAHAAEKTAEDLEGKIQAAAMNIGRPDLADQLAQSRTIIAKTYDVEKALNPANGEISAPKLASLAKQGKPLSGNLKVIADMGNAFKPFMGEGSTTPAAGVSKLKSYAGTIGTFAGAHFGGAIGAGIGAVLPYGTDMVRAGITNPKVAAFLSHPTYPVMPDFRAQMGNLATQGLLRDGLSQYLPQTPQ